MKKPARPRENAAYALKFGTISYGVIPEDRLWISTALHGQAREKVDEVNPRGTNRGVGPIDKDDPLGRDEDVVGTDVCVEQRCPLMGTVRCGGDIGKPFEIRPCPTIQSGKFVQRTRISGEH